MLGQSDRAKKLNDGYHRLQHVATVPRLVRFHFLPVEFGVVTRVNERNDVQCFG